MTDLEGALAGALDRRADFLADAARRGTDCVRLLHGAAEGAPGVTVDRYGGLLLVQTTRAPLERSAIERVHAACARALGAELAPVWNHRPAFRREGFAAHFPDPAAVAPIGAEEGARFCVEPRHGGLDPLLFLDLRPARRAVRALARGRTVLNLFAYTCGVGVAAALGGAREVVNVDFARSALAFGARNAALNALEAGHICAQRRGDHAVTGPSFRLVHEDVFPIVRQLAGLPIKGRGARRSYLRVAPRRFDVVLIDPPRWAKTPFGAVDVVRDYPSLLKPALLATADGGTLIATHHVPEVEPEAFLAIVARTADKCGRPLADLALLPLDADFPSPAGQPAALKIAVATLNAHAAV